MSPRRKPAKTTSATTNLCGKCGLTLEEAPLFDFREDLPVFGPDPDLDVLLATAAADNAALLDALASQPEIELPLSVYRAELQPVRDHVEGALAALSVTDATRPAREQLQAALAALDGLGVRRV